MQYSKINPCNPLYQQFKKKSHTSILIYAGKALKNVPHSFVVKTQQNMNGYEFL